MKGQSTQGWEGLRKLAKDTEVPRISKIGSIYTPGGDCYELELEPVGMEERDLRKVSLRRR